MESVAPVFHGMVLTNAVVVVVMAAPSMLRATFVASMVVLDRTVRASATEWLAALLRSLSVPMLMVDPTRMLSAVPLAMMTRLALVSALVTGP